MTLEQALTLVTPVELVEPGPFARKTVLEKTHGRYANMYDLRVVDGRCAWCNESSVPKNKKKYCSSKCSESGRWYTHPQTPAHKAYHLIHRQNAACSECGLDYSDQIVEKIEKNFRRNGDAVPAHIKSRVSYFHIGVNTGDIWHVDHIVPIHKGGRGIGFDNIQVICVECHKKKTVRDRGKNG